VTALTVAAADQGRAVGHPTRMMRDAAKLWPCWIRNGSTRRFPLVCGR